MVLDELSCKKHETLRPPPTCALTTEGFQMRGGSAEPLVVFGCLRQMTADRTEELLNLVPY